MVAAQHQRHGAGGQNLADGVLGIGMAFVHIGVHDIGVTHIDDTRLVAREVHHIVLMIVGPGMAKGIPVEAAQAKAAELDPGIRAAVK